jgi:hypothetical protein
LPAKHNKLHSCVTTNLFGAAGVFVHLADVLQIVTECRRPRATVDNGTRQENGANIPRKFIAFPGTTFISVQKYDAPLLAMAHRP